MFHSADADVCDVASEEWGREENNRLQYTSTGGYYRLGCNVIDFPGKNHFNNFTMSKNILLAKNFQYEPMPGNLDDNEDTNMPPNRSLIQSVWNH